MVTSPVSACETIVSYPLPVASGACVGTVACVPPSGSLFPVGTTLVNCSTPQTNCSFIVTVLDTDPPVLKTPADLTLAAEPGRCAATVEYTVNAGDNCPGATYLCTPPSGALFPVGITTVTCSASDLSGNVTQGSFKVTVDDTQVPAIAQPPDVSKSADPGKTNVVVAFPLPVAQDNCPGVTVTCLPPSGSIFPSGITAVTCTARDASKNVTSSVFKVTVTIIDDEKPRINCPADIVTTNDVGLCSAVIRYTATAVDNLPGVTVACAPPSGSVFPNGATRV